MKYQLSWKASTKEALVQADGEVVPEGFTPVGEFTYDPDDASPPLGPDTSHVIYHEVQELLYHKGVQDIMFVTLLIPKEVTGVSVTPATLAMEVDDEEQLTVTVTPANAEYKSVTYSDFDEEVISVSATGLVTALATGTTTITVTTFDGEFTDTVAVTVTAA